MRKLGWLALLIAVLAAGVLAQENLTTVKEIDTYCNKIDAAVKRRKEPDRVFADSASETSKHEKWKSFASTKALEKFRKRQEVYTIAFNWLSGGKVVRSNFTLSSPSGDWAKYVYHWFRADGTLAREESEYRTFMGDFIVIRRRYFDSKGRHLKSSVRFLDLTTGKPKDASEGVMGDDPKEVDYYKKTSELPFAHLLKKK
jgi:hypothetical protein